jgi:hypothetical protein
LWLLRAISLLLLVRRLNPAQAISITKSDGTLVSTYDVQSSTNLSILDKTLTINLSNDLSKGTTYKATFEAGAIVDLNNNKYSQSGDYQFTTIRAF